MNRYTTIKQLGDGTYGSVLLGRSVESGELVAIKRMKRKFYSWDECMNLREVKSLKKLNHANVIKLKEVIRENDHLYFVFEYMKENLYQLMRDRNKLFPEPTIRNIMYQILQGLAYIHKYGFFHRDLKPENLLCIGPELVKIADFGLARETRSRPPYTDYVSTRWYRAPEVLLRSTNYNSPIDIWAVGCIMAEVYTLRPLFPGSSEIDTIFKICQVLGTPKKSDWLEGYQLASGMNFRWPQCVPNNLKTLVPNASSEGIQVMRDMLQWDPKKRPTASQALRYPYFLVGQPLGTPQQIQEVNQVPKNHQEKQATLLIKPAPPSQPPPKYQPRLASRAFQQAQSNVHLIQMGSSLAESNSAQENSKLNQPHLPALVPQKVASNSESNNEVHTTKNRRRWGVITKEVKGSDEWDDLEDLGVRSSINISEMKNEIKGPLSDDAVCSFESIVDLKRTDSVVAGPVLNSFSRQETGVSRRPSAAKQHYLKHSRYLPGLTIKKSAVENPNKSTAPSSNPWPNVLQPLKPLGGSTCTSDKLSGLSIGNGPLVNYTPSFFKKEIGYAGQKVHLAPLSDPAPNYGSLKSVGSYLGQTSFNSPPKKSSGLSSRPLPAIAPIHGRTDWISKYGGRR
ncbi:serine/threonine-protein kinase ICK [Spea bombifrons]|uniref:serine/threonine-protein kinase ICK n=1 Tax=Spea bombifrons TaxID=233779 RepID=UPI00234B2270|nr:serine/threonine-protein kinase ICK [Spea bombifrons]XP_053315620.1 serine/threonine-protein kinase ICK [Spea bombifrons]XP_053315621.1 serine/threonine-protein kinase ICK [Spea bombifrons]